MRKWLRIALASLVGLFVVLLAASQMILNTKWITDVIDEFAVEYIDGKLAYSRPKVSVISSFPSVRVRLDSVSLTYPHDLFQRDDRRGGALGLCGVGTELDTLAAFDHLDLKVNPFSLIGRKLNIRNVRLDGFRAYVHVYDAQSCNLDILKLGSDEKESDEGSRSGAFKLSVGQLEIGGNPRFVYDNRSSRACAEVAFRSFAFSGKVHLDDGAVTCRNITSMVDSLSLFAENRVDTLNYSLPELVVSQPGTDVFDLHLSSEALLRLQEYGRLVLPFDLSGRVKVAKGREAMDLSSDGIRATLAYMPLSLDGQASFLSDSAVVKAALRLEDCPLDTIRSRYAERFVPAFRDFSTDARISADLEADGVLSADKFPSLEACLRIPHSHTKYYPENIEAELTVDIDAVMSSDKVLNADIHEFCLVIPGIDVDLDGEALDLLGADPTYMLSADASADIGQFMTIVPERFGITNASGDVRLNLSARTRRSELMSYKFTDADIEGRLRSRNLAVSMNSDSINTVLFNSAIDLRSGKTGFDLSVDFDSLYFNNGVELITRIRNIRNEGHLSKTLLGGELLPKLSFSSKSERLFFKFGSGRYGLNGTDFAVSAQKIVPKPEVKKKRKMPAFLQEKDFEKADVDISLDSSLVKYLRNWSTEGHIKADDGYYSSPSLPLRTRLTALDAYMNDRELMIEALGINSGTSDLTVCGYVRGLKKSLMGKDMLNVYLLADSRRINANEFISAIMVGEKDYGDVSVAEEMDESFVTDTLENAKVYAKDLPLFVVPGNVDLTLKMSADRIDFSDPHIGPVTSGIRIKDRTMQLTSTDVTTDIGDINLDAFYSTRTKSDISTGVNLSLKGMRAKEIVNLIPAVDTLMPALKAFEGKLGLDLSVTTQLDTNRNVLVPTIDGVMRVRGEDLKIYNQGMFGKMTSRLIFGKHDALSIDNLSADAIVHDSRVEVFPFILGTDRLKLALRGTQNFDKSMYYHVSVLKSPVLVRFGVNVYGTTDNWHLSLGRAKYRDGHIPSYTKQLDTVQINLSKSIRNIFKRGVGAVMRHNGSALNDIEERSRKLDPMSRNNEELNEMEMDEYADMIGDFVCEQEMMDQSEAIEKEVNEALASSAMNMDDFYKQYEDSIYDRRIHRKMERAKRRDARKAARLGY